MSVFDDVFTKYADDFAAFAEGMYIHQNSALEVNKHAYRYILKAKLSQKASDVFMDLVPNEFKKEFNCRLCLSTIDAVAPLFFVSYDGSIMSLGFNSGLSHNSPFKAAHSAMEKLLIDSVQNGAECTYLHFNKSPDINNDFGIGLRQTTNEEFEDVYDFAGRKIGEKIIERDSLDNIVVHRHLQLPIYKAYTIDSKIDYIHVRKLQHGRLKDRIRSIGITELNHKLSKIANHYKSPNFIKDNTGYGKSLSSESKALYRYTMTLTKLLDIKMGNVPMPADNLYIILTNVALLPDNYLQKLLRTEHGVGV